MKFILCMMMVGAKLLEYFLCISIWSILSLEADHLVALPCDWPLLVSWSEWDKITSTWSISFGVVKFKDVLIDGLLRDVTTSLDSIPHTASSIIVYYSCRLVDKYWSLEAATLKTKKKKEMQCARCFLTSVVNYNVRPFHKRMMHFLHYLWTVTHH